MSETYYCLINDPLAKEQFRIEAFEEVEDVDIYETAEELFFDNNSTYWVMTTEELNMLLKSIDNVLSKKVIKYEVQKG